MASVFDVAAYILAKKAPITAMKLQKLVYYAQAWSLVWDEKPLFKERIEAWANGPVVPDLYQAHRGCFRLDKGDIPGDPTALTASERGTVDAVLNAYGGKTSQWLSEATHSEKPWKDARVGVPHMAPSSNEIKPAALAEYYGGL